MYETVPKLSLNVIKIVSSIVFHVQFAVIQILWILDIIGIWYDSMPMSISILILYRGTICKFMSLFIEISGIVDQFVNKNLHTEHVKFSKINFCQHFAFWDHTMFTMMSVNRYAYVYVYVYMYVYVYVYVYFVKS